MNKLGSERLQENTVDTVFQNMDDFYLPNEFDKFTMSLKLAFPKFSKGFSASDFDQFIEKVVGVSNVVSLGRLSFPNEWQMQVSCPSTREKLIREYPKVKINGRSCTISPLSQSEVRGFVNWVPSQIPNSELEDVLKKYGEVLFVENQTVRLKVRSLDEAKKLSFEEEAKFRTASEKVSDSRYFGLFLRSGQTVEDIPYFITLCERQCFVSITGRSPLCFHCKVVGHIKKECKVYSQKLDSYCNRKPTGLKRKKPRGRRNRQGCRSDTKGVPADKEVVTQALTESLTKLNLTSKDEQICANEEITVSPDTLNEIKPMPVNAMEDIGKLQSDDALKASDNLVIDIIADLQSDPKEDFVKQTGAKSKKKKNRKKKKKNVGVSE